MSQVLTAPAPRNELVVLLDDSGLDASKTRILSSRFADYFTIAEQWKTEAQQLVVTGEDQQELMLRARQGRLVLKDKRVQIERTRKELKEDSLKEGRAIDAVAKLLTSLIEPTEKFLLEQEEFAKNAQEARAADVRGLVARRRADLVQYNYEGPETDEWLANATADAFYCLVSMALAQHLARKRKADAEAEAQRKADQRNRDELLLENQRLQNEQRQQQLESEAKWQKQEQEQQLLRDEAQGLRDAETKRQRQQRADEQQLKLKLSVLASGPDKLKLVALADRIHELNQGLTADSVQGEKARTIVASVDNTLDKIQHWLREQADIL